MKKSILNLVGTQELSKSEQQKLNGGAGGKPELCFENDINGQILACYAPLRCKLNEGGGYSYCG